MSDVTTEPRTPRLATAKALVAGNPLLVVIAGIGFAVSFQTIARLAQAQHMPGWPVLYPVLIDVGILALVIEARKAISDGRSDVVARAMAWVLAGFTVYVNAHGSPARDWLGISLHVLGPALWVVFLELTRWRKIRKARMPTQEEARLARALADARRYAVDLARSLRGPLWRWRVPSLLRINIARSRFPDEVREEIERCVRLGKTTGWQAAVRGWVTGPEGLHLGEAAEVASRKAAETIRQEAFEVAPQTVPGVPSGTVPEAVSGPSRSTSPGVPRKPSPSAVKRMSGADLAPYVGTLLEGDPGLTKAAVMKALRVGEPKAAEALRIARRNMPTPLRVAR